MRRRRGFNAGMAVRMVHDFVPGTLVAQTVLESRGHGHDAPPLKTKGTEDDCARLLKDRSLSRACEKHADGNDRARLSRMACGPVFANNGPTSTTGRGRPCITA